MVAHWLIGNILSLYVNDFILYVNKNAQEILFIANTQVHDLNCFFL